MKMERTKRYTAWANNSVGASISVGQPEDFFKDGFPSIASVERQARSELGAGWRVHIVDIDGNETKVFSIR
jgi:hypothetical protein